MRLNSNALIFLGVILCLISVLVGGDFAGRAGWDNLPDNFLESLKTVSTTEGIPFDSPYVNAGGTGHDIPPDGSSGPSNGDYATDDKVPEILVTGPGVSAGESTGGGSYVLAGAPAGGYIAPAAAPASVSKASSAASDSESSVSSGVQPMALAVNPGAEVSQKALASSTPSSSAVLSPKIAHVVFGFVAFVCMLIVK